MQLSLDQLEPAARKRGLNTIFAVTFLMNAGFFLIIPLVSVHYVDRLGWAAAFIGLVLAVRQFVQQGLTVFGGALADRFGPRRLILTGIMIRTISFVVMGFATVPWMLMLSGFLAAIGGALFDAPQRATLATLAPEDRLNEMYGRLGILQNVARTVGPLIGAFLIHFDFMLVGLGSAAFFLVAFFITLAFLPPVSVCSTTQSARAGLKLASRDVAFVIFTVLMMGYWFMWVQLSIAMPLEIKHLTGRDSSVGIMFTISAVLAVVLQVPALRLAERFLRPTPTIVAGMAVMAAGMGIFALTQSVVAFYLALFFFSLGSVLATPSAQTVTAEMADDRARGAYFGVGSLAIAVGGGLGHIMGGTLVDMAAQRQMPALPWVVFAVVGLMSAIGLWLFYMARQSRPPRRWSHAPASGD
ncbi:MAG: MFS transporter [Anaerolineae bacterium]|nr:MFS transporter [Anaerolineae bacterium]RIK18289.1 MAG: MFS transporter [Anaerolineae bacterium]